MANRKRNINKKYYPIEKILKKRTVNGKTEYFIKWLNYTDKYNSWQPKENIKRIKPKTNRGTLNKQPVKILARFEKNWCLVKWANGRTSTIQLSTRQTYEIIVNGNTSQ